MLFWKLRKLRARNPQARRTFRDRHGFDPLAGFAVESVAPGATGDALDPLRAALVERLQRTGRPVMVFLPEIGSVRLLPPAGSAAEARPRSE